MIIAARLGHRVLFVLLFAFSFSGLLEAAPGRLTSTGPFAISGAARQLVYPGADPRWILALSRENLFETRDGGVNWRSLLMHQPAMRMEKLIVDPSDARRFFVMGFAGSRKILETRDGGRSWSPVAVPAGPLPDSRLADFFIDVAAPRTLVAELQDFLYLPGYRYFVSFDGGGSWSPRAAPADAGPLLGVREGIGWTRAYRADFRSGVFTPHPSGEFSPNPMLSATELVFDRVRGDTFFIERANGISVTRDGGATFGATVPGVLDGFSQSPVDPGHIAWSFQSGGNLLLSPDRGATWARQEELPFAFRTAFDPATGEVVYTSFGAIHRRRLDGSLAPPLPAGGLMLSWPAQILVAGPGQAFMLDGLSRLHHRDEEGTWRPRGLASAAIPFGFEICSGPASLLVSPTDGRRLILACGLTREPLASGDGGRTWSFSRAAEPESTESLAYEPALALARGGAGDVVYLLRRGDLRWDPDTPGNTIFRSTDFGATWQSVGAGFLEMVVHPDSSRGLIASRTDGRLMRYLPAGGWQEVPTAASQRFLPDYDFQATDLAFGYDPAHPELVYSIHHAATFRSLDFGATWQMVAGLSDAFPGTSGYQGELSTIARILVDPFDAEHFLIPGTWASTRDGGRSYQSEEEAASYAASFDPATPGHFLTGSESAGVLEITASLPPCPNTAAAWCAGGGRFLVTVDWKDPQGNEGKAAKVATGSEDSGLFYFFDQNNWELLVKVLDGCGLNQRFWVLAAGTTDVEYSMKVEDRWTGQIRHYANAAGRAAPAVIDTDALSGCGQAPPPGAAAPPLPPASQALTGGETVLPLAGGRFAASARWTDFAGAQGDAFTAPLRSDNSGLFYFFSPNNWEVLVKVLDGCAINGHYWVLAAATTDVGYRLEIRDTERPRSKVYGNPVGQAAPAQIDLQAFSCD